MWRYSTLPSTCVADNMAEEFEWDGNKGEKDEWSSGNPGGDSHSLIGRIGVKCCITFEFCMVYQNRSPQPDWECSSSCICTLPNSYKVQGINQGIPHSQGRPAHSAAIFLLSVALGILNSRIFKIVNIFWNFPRFLLYKCWCGWKRKRRALRCVSISGISWWMYSKSTGTAGAFKYCLLILLSEQVNSFSRFYKFPQKWWVPGTKIK